MCDKSGLKLGVVLTVAVAGVFAAGRGGHRSPAGTIVFQSDRGDAEALYVIRPDGTGLGRITLGLPADGADVYWSPDGTKALIAYDTGNGRPVAYLFDSASRTRRRIRLPEPEALSLQPWSPDGKRLVLSTRAGDLVLDMATGVSTALNDRLADDLLTWSPDGTHLLYPSRRDLYTVPADGGPPTRLMRLRREPGNLQWSSDGRWISFLDDGLYAVRTDGTGFRRIDPNAEEAAWSPTSERLVFPRSTGLVLVDFETGRRRQLTRDQLGDDPKSLTWSPDGKRIAYLHSDLGFGAGEYAHDQVWTVNADGTGERPVTHAFPDDGTISDGSVRWVAARLHGTPDPTLPLVSFRATRAITTRLPIVALAAEGNRAAVAQGFGGPVEMPSPLGPIVVWNRMRGTRAEVPIRRCGSVYDVLLTAGRVAYRCDKSNGGYSVHDALRLGTRTLIRTHGEEFSGSFLGGIVADRGTIAFDAWYETGGPDTSHIGQTHVWKVTGRRMQIVRTFKGAVGVAALDAGRIAVVRDGTIVSVVFPGGAVRTYSPGGGTRILGAAIDGTRLIVLRSKRLTVVDLNSGRSLIEWPLRRRFGLTPELEDVQGNLAAYVVGVAIHILRLSDGRDVVIDTPTATDPVLARFVPSGLFYSFNESNSRQPGRLVFVARTDVEGALSRR